MIRDEPVIDAHHHLWDPATADYPWMTDDLADRKASTFRVDGRNECEVGVVGDCATHELSHPARRAEDADPDHALGPVVRCDRGFGRRVGPAERVLLERTDHRERHRLRQHAPGHPTSVPERHGVDPVERLVDGEDLALRDLGLPESRHPPTRVLE